MTDETADYATSLHAPGEILPGGPDDGVDFGADDDADAAANDAEVRDAGYDVDAVAGDTDAVRPQ
jgi:hypothetical protein